MPNNRISLWLGMLVFFTVGMFQAAAGDITPAATSSKPTRQQKDYRPYPQPDAGYVSDFARLMTRQQEEKIEQMLWRTEEHTGVEVVVMTVDSINDYPDTDNASIETFAAALFDKYGIGNQPKNNGILLLVAYKDHKARIELGKGYGHNRDADALRIMDRIIIPEFKGGRYDQGIVKGVDALVKEFTGKAPNHSWKPKEQAGSAVPGSPVSPSPAAAKSSGLLPSSIMEFLSNPLVLIVLILLLTGIAVSLFQSGKSGWGWICVGLVFVLVLMLIRTVVAILSAMFSNNDHGDSGGWSSGGFGGGFGGGSSGGGGASGSW